MMASLALTQNIVIQGSRTLPSFPAAISSILGSLDDPDGKFDLIVQAISQDPLISARVLSVANSVAMRSVRDFSVCDIGMATSLIGLNRVRHIALISSLSTFVAGAVQRGLPVTFWKHCVATGICAEELALYIDSPVSPTMALVSGLTHDIGQLWLFNHSPEKALSCWQEAHDQNVGVDAREQKYFGVDHSTIGAWLAGHWNLPADVTNAIAGHHQPDTPNSSPLVDLVHVAEVMSNALDLTGRSDNRVTNLSTHSCERLGLVWNDDVSNLFGRIEARARHANEFFTLPTGKH